jgi:hypothetical protein
VHLQAESQYGLPWRNLVELPHREWNIEELIIADDFLQFTLPHVKLVFADLNGTCPLIYRDRKVFFVMELLYALG